MKKVRKALAVLLAVLFAASISISTLAASGDQVIWRRNSKPNCKQGKVELYPYEMYYRGSVLVVELYLTNGKDRDIKNIRMTDVQIVSNGYVAATGKETLAGTTKSGHRTLFSMRFNKYNKNALGRNAKVDCSAHIEYDFAS